MAKKSVAKTSNKDGTCMIEKVTEVITTITAKGISLPSRSRMLPATRPTIRNCWIVPHIG